MTQQIMLEPDRWIDTYADVLFAYTMKRVRDQQQAEDLVQECFLSAWRSRHTFNGSNEQAWLFAICKNKIIDHYRAAASSATRSASSANSSASSANSSLNYYFDVEDHWTNNAKPRPWSLQDHWLDQHDPDNPIAQTDHKDFLRVLDSCRNKLNSMQYAAFTLKYLDQLETKEVCSKLGITVKNYWVLIHRAKLQLRECLQVNWINIK